MARELRATGIKPGTGRSRNSEDEGTRLMKMLFVATALAVGVTALAPRTSHAVLIDFATTGAAGDLGTSVFIDPGTGCALLVVWRH